ncbi:helix-turn-helix domain-containing protein [Pseudonocardia sp. DSM 110487]|uniref:winged helix-turn-helix transcriptional regulator n=1 Tax=Pseudonocardia sp. DSM 110487 TaxID=2865833 RepID=UPI0021041A0A|nr:helix-turn-helix domain-containing protein [Pseudonocardia sp. DSM 110487]
MDDAETPLPGSPVRGSRTGRPIMAALDLLGRRWALRILWELRDGAVGFRALQERCDGLSPTVLNTRLSELRAAGLVEQDEKRAHRLTPLGEDLGDAIAPLRAWSVRWAESTSDA